MFTAPVGNFKFVPIGYRPTANSVTLVGSGASVSPENAYDGDDTTSAFFSCGASGSSTCVYSTFVTSLTSTTAVLSVVIEGSGIGFHITTSISVDGGLTYPLTLSPNLRIVGGVSIADKQTCSMVLPSNVPLSDVCVKFALGTDPSGTELYVYDIVIEQ